MHHEARDQAVEAHAVEVALVREEEEVVHGQRRFVRKQGEGHASEVGGDNHPRLAGGNIHGGISVVGVSSRFRIGLATPHGHNDQQQRHHDYPQQAHAPEFTSSGSLIVAAPSPLCRTRVTRRMITERCQRETQVDPHRSLPRPRRPRGRAIRESVTAALR